MDKGEIVEDKAAYLPSLSIIIVTLNYERVIGQCLQRYLKGQKAFKWSS